MSDNSQNPLDADETIQPQLELSDLPDDTEGREPEESGEGGDYVPAEVVEAEDEGQTGALVVSTPESTVPPAVEDEWVRAARNPVSLPFTVTVLGGATNWNTWRKSQPGKICLDEEGKQHVLGLKLLSEFNLSGMNLREYKFTGNKTMVGADFTGSLLNSASFNGADLRKAKFNRADLTSADFSETRLSGAILDEETIFDSIKSTENVTVGINGIYVRRKNKASDEEEIESAALMTLIPAGDSMKGHSSEAVMENLKHARQLNTASILAVSVVTVILIFPTIQGVKVPVLDVPLSVGWVSIIAQIVCLVYQFLVLNHIRDAADGAKYLRTREDAMKIATFPWGISNYPGKQPQLAKNFLERVRTFNAWWPWFSNDLNRRATSFYPMLFVVGGIVYFLRHWEKYTRFNLFIVYPKYMVTLYYKPLLFILCILALMFFSWLVYQESRRFIRPIVFDAESEKAPKSDLTSLAESVKEQLRITKRLASFIETAIPRYSNLGDRFSDRLPGGVEIPMRIIPAGAFKRGSLRRKDEQPVLEVTVRQFWMSEHQVTQRLWKAVMGRLPDQLIDDKFINPRYPVIEVSWNDAIDFCRKLNDLLGLTEEYGYRLPTEAEWEYAARGRTTTDYTTTDYSFDGGEAELGEYAWFSKNSEGHPWQVGQKKQNPFGLYDMHGNVWEWCQDHWHGNYDKAPRDGTAWETGEMAAYRVLRGGSWGNYAFNCRSAYRLMYAPGHRDSDVGFRLSRTLPSALLPFSRDENAPPGQQGAATAGAEGAAEPPASPAGAAGL
jgi:formylglycine-generating enzyme required for sulfatase activity